MATMTVSTYKDGTLVESRTVEVPDEQVNGDVIDNRLDKALDGLRAYIGAASPTQAQTVAVVKLLCRVAVALIRRQRGRLDATD